MDDSEIERIVDNEKEWRRNILKKVVTMEENFVDMKLDIHGMKIWNRIGKGVILALFGGLIAWVRDQLQI